MDDIKFSQLIINFKFENTFCIRSSVMKLNVSLIYATALIGVHPGQPYNQLFMGSTSYNHYVKCFLFSSRVTQTHLFAPCASHDRPTTLPKHILNCATPAAANQQYFIRPLNCNAENARNSLTHSHESTAICPSHTHTSLLGWQPA